MGLHFSQFKERDTYILQCSGGSREQRYGVAVVYTLRFAIRRQADRCAVGPYSIDYCLRYFAEQADTIFDRTSILIGPEIGIIAQELINQIAISGVDLYTVESSRNRVFRSVDIVFYNSWNLRRFKRSCFGIRLFPFGGMSISRGRCRRCRYGLGAAQKIGMHETPHMPQLQDDLSAGFVHGFRHRLPRSNLRIVPNPRCGWPA